MSDSNGPVRRRRIAGESGPATPAKKAPVKKSPAKKSTAKAVPAKKPAAKVAPTGKSATKAAPAKKVTAAPAPATKAAKAAPVAAPAKKVTARPVPVSPGPAVATPSRRPSQDEVRNGPSRRDLRWLVPAIVVTVAALVVGGWSAVRGISDARDGGGNVSTAQRQATSAAGSAAETIFSYTYDKLPEHLTASKALMTPAFAKSFEKIAPALDEIAPQRKVQVQAVTRGAAPLRCGDECSATKVSVLVFLDQARLVDGAKQPDVIGNRISVVMVKRGGSWLVQDIRAL